MKHTLTFLTTLTLGPLAVRHAGRHLPGVPATGILRGENVPFIANSRRINFQYLELTNR